MIRHIVFFSARKRDDVDVIAQGLRELGKIPFSTAFEVAVNAKIDPMGNDVDVVVYAEFPDRAALDAYKRHPIYAETTARVRPLRDSRFSADIEAAPPIAAI
jgi:hypothetical protein